MTKHNLSTSPSKITGSVLIKLFIFFLLLILILSSIGVLLRERTETTFRWDTFYETAEKENIDILLLGSSQSFRGLDPRVFTDNLNLSSYNLSTSAQVISQTYYTLVESLRFTKPNLVILETYFFDESSLIEDRWYFAYEEVAAMKFSTNKFNYIFDLFTWDTYIDAFFPAIREHDNWSDEETLEKNNNYLKLGEQKLQMYNGFIPDETHLSYENIQKYLDLEYHIQKFEIDDKDLFYIEKIVNLCKENDINLIFVKTAMPKYHTEKTNYNDFYNETKRIADLLGIPFIDFNIIYNQVGFENIHFRDEFSTTNHHLNTMGAKLTTDYLVDYIIENKILK